jgi:hypothetical protein
MKPHAFPLTLLLGLCSACSRREAAPRGRAPAATPTPATATADAPATPAHSPVDAAAPGDPPANPSRFGLTMTAQPMPPGPHGTPRQRLALVLRLPSGVQQTRDLGEVAGTCTAPPPPPGLLGLYHCETAGTGSEFVIRRNGPEIVVTRLGVESGTATAQSREVARMTAPAGDIVTFQVAP